MYRMKNRRDAKKSRLKRENPFCLYNYLDFIGIIRAISSIQKMEHLLYRRKMFNNTTLKCKYKFKKKG